MPSPKKLQFSSSIPDFIGSGDDFIDFEIQELTPSEQDEQDRRISEFLQEDEDADLETKDFEAEATALMQLSPPPLANATALSEPQIASLEDQITAQFMSDEFIL